MSIQPLQPTVANFVQKSFQIISNQQYYHIIEWLPSGKQFIIKDTDLFENIILPQYFRHRNINSFIRQLNMYGFHKSRKQPTKNIFSHPNFVKGKQDNLINVRRKLKEDKNNEENVANNLIMNNGTNHNNMNHVHNNNFNNNNNVNNTLLNKKLKLQTPVKQNINHNNIIPHNIHNRSISNLPNSTTILSRQTFRSKHNIYQHAHPSSNYHNISPPTFYHQKKQRQLQKTAIKASQILTSFCSIGHLQQANQQQHSEYPFIRSLFQKSQIMQLNPQLYAMKFQNITSLNHIDQIQFQFSDHQLKQDNQIEKERKKLNNRMIGYNILQTINFMSQMDI